MSFGWVQGIHIHHPTLFSIFLFMSGIITDYVSRQILGFQHSKMKSEPKMHSFVPRAKMNGKVGFHA